jgi:rod shape determining protein RodA
MPKELVKVKTIKTVELLLITLIISLIGMHVIGHQNPEKIFNLQLYFIFATVVVCLMSFVKFSTIQHYTYTMYFITISLLALVLLYGYMAGGATRWISFGKFRFQPSELLKLVLPLVLIKYYQSDKLPLSKKRIYISILIIAIPVFLVLLQPDLGTTLIIIISSIFIPFLLGLKKRTIQLTSAFLLIMLPIFWNLLLPYQQTRIRAYLNPGNYSSSSFQVQQSIIAIKKGGMFGQSIVKVNVPAGTTDFIFSMYTNEFGALGVLFLIIFFNRLIKNIIYLAKSTKNPILTALAGSYAFLLTCSLLVNIFMVTGLLPVVGLPMPFMSYGGTAFLVNITIITILVTAFRKSEKYPIKTIGEDFQKRQHSRMKLLTYFLSIGQLLILLRLLFIYLK